MATEVEMVPADSVYDEGERQALIHKWIESERAHRDLGILAMREWVRQYWYKHLRTCWYEHIIGKRFWSELDRGDFGILRCKPPSNSQLLSQILGMLIEGRENLDVINWALDHRKPMDGVLEILELLDINRCRLAHHLWATDQQCKQG